MRHRRCHKIIRWRLLRYDEATTRTLELTIHGPGGPGHTLPLQATATLLLWLTYLLTILWLCRLLRRNKCIFAAVLWCSHLLFLWDAISGGAIKQRCVLEIFSFNLDENGATKKECWHHQVICFTWSYVSLHLSSVSQPAMCLTPPHKCGRRLTRGDMRRRE